MKNGFKLKKLKKVEILASQNFGKIVRYRRQNFKINEAIDYSGSADNVKNQGVYILAIENGRVEKGFSQWVSYTWLRNKLKTQTSLKTK